MIAGIEGLATGFLKGLDARRLNDRQDVKDAQDAERFNMDKERFATQQQVDAFNLQNAQTEAGRKTADYTRANQLQAKQDAFHANMQSLYAKKANKDPSLFTDVQNWNKQFGVKGDLLLDGSGNPRIDPNGNAIMTNTEDGKAVVLDYDKAIESYYNAFNPEKTFESQAATQADIAKEKRTNDAELGRLKVQHNYRLSEQSAADKEANYRAGLTKPPKEPDVLPANLLPYFTEEVEVGKDRNGTPIMKKAINQAAVDSFLQWSTENKTTASPKAYQLWRSSKPVIQGATRPQVGGKGDVVGDWIKSRNIGTQDELNSAIAELRAKNPNWSKEQLKQAFVNAGVME